MRNLLLFLVLAITASCSENKEMNKRLAESVTRIEKAISYGNSFPTLVETVSKIQEIKNEQIRDSLLEHQYFLLRSANRSYKCFFDSIATDMAYFKDNGLDENIYSEFVDMLSEAKAYMNMVQEPALTQDMFIEKKRSLQKTIETFKMKHLVKE